MDESEPAVLRGISFGAFRFEPAGGRLWFGAQELRLTPKAAAVLTVLLAHAGEPVSKDTLFAAVWPNTVVSDDALTSCVQELRKTFADDPRLPRYIETRHRRGYRFIAKPVALGAPALAGALRPSGRPSIAVLPFDNISGDANQEYFSDGITEDIITALSRYRTLLVIARGSTFAFKGQRIDVRRVGNQLGADYVIEGSVGKSGRSVRITARLVETGAGRSVWAEHYDRDLGEIFEVQDEIVATIAAQIEPEIGCAERVRVEAKAPEALRAWDCFHLGMSRFYKATPAENLEAQRLFRRAIELDPDLAQAYAWLAYAIVLGMVYFEAAAGPDRLNEAVAIARKAIELDEQDALTHFACGRALLACKAYRESLAELESAIVLNPNLAAAYCGFGDSLAYEGRFAEAFPFFEKAINLSPYDPQRWAFYSYRALAHLFAGEFDLAFGSAHSATRIPNCHYWPFVHRVSALGHLRRQGEHWEAELPGALAELRQRKPGLACGFARERLFYVKDPQHLDLYVAGLRNAGVRE